MSENGKNGTGHHVRLTDVVAKPGTVTLTHKGEEITVAVRHINAPIAQALDDADKMTGVPRLLAFYAVAAMCVPDAPPEAVSDLSDEQIAVIIAMASRNVEKLKELLREGEPKPPEGEEGADRPPTVATVTQTE